MSHTLNRLETIGALAHTIGHLSAEENPVWYSVYAEELKAEAQAAREDLCRESSYVATLIKAAVIAETKGQRNELLALAVKTLESGNKDYQSTSR